MGIDTMGDWQCIVRPLSDPALWQHWDDHFSKGRAHYQAKVVNSAGLDGQTYLAIAFFRGKPCLGAMVRKRGLLGWRLELGVPLTLSGPHEANGVVSNDQVRDFYKRIGRELRRPIVFVRRCRLDAATSCHGLLKAEPFHFMDISANNIEEWLAKQKPRRRKRLRRAHRQLRSGAYQLVRASLVPEDAEELRPLFEQWAKKRHWAGNIDFKSYMSTLSAASNGDQFTYKIYKNDQLIAFDILCETAESVECTFIGFDYKQTAKIPVYQMLYLWEKEGFLESRRRSTVQLGQGCATPKRRLGARSEERFTGLIFANTCMSWLIETLGGDMFFRSSLKPTKR